MGISGSRPLQSSRYSSQHLFEGGCAEYPVMIPDNQIEKITQKRAMLDGRGQNGMCGYLTRTVPNELPKVGFHGLQTSTDKPGKAHGCLRSTGLKQVPVHDSLLPALFVRTTEK